MTENDLPNWEVLHLGRGRSPQAPQNGAAVTGNSCRYSGSHRAASRLIERAMVDRRTAAKLIRFHPEELQQIVECARRSGLTPARFIRETARGATPRARSYAVDQPLLNELARIGRGLDQPPPPARATPDPAPPAD